MKENVIVLTVGGMIAIGCIVWARWDSRIDTVEVGDGEIRYKAAGEGSPTVVLEAGMGMKLDSFDAIFDEVAAHTRTFAYDRPGYGDSDPTKRSRSIDRLVQDLHTLLESAGEKPPYLLAGHSLGGFIVIEFAQAYPDETAGVLLIDSPHPNSPDWAGKLDVDLRPPDDYYYGLPAIIRRELDAVMEYRLEGDLGDIPLIVLTAGDDSKDPLGPLAVRSRNELIALSTNGKGLHVRDSSHLMVYDVPEVIVQNIVELLNRTR